MLTSKVTETLGSLQGPRAILSPEGLDPGAASLWEALRLLHICPCTEAAPHGPFIESSPRLAWGEAEASEATNPDLKEKSGKDRSTQLYLMA